MLQLHTRTHRLTLPPEIELTLNFTNPIFDKEAIDRVWSYPITLPATPINQLALGLSTRLDGRFRKPRVPATLSIDAEFELYGELKIESATPTDIKVTFQNTSLRIAKKLRDLRLRSLKLTNQVTSFYNTRLVLSAVYLVQHTQWAIQINNDVFTATIPNFSTLINAINAKYPNTAVDLGATFPLSAQERLILFQNLPDPGSFRIYLRPGVSNPGATAFFHVFQTDFKKEATRINAAWVTHLQGEGNSLARYPVIKAPQLYGTKNSKWNGYANYINAATQEYTTSDADIGAIAAWTDTALPQPMLLPIISQIASTVALNAIGGTFLNDAEIKKLLIWNNLPVDKIISDYDYIVDERPDAQGFLPDQAIARAHTYQPSFNIADYLPDISALDMILNLANTFCLFIQVRNGILKLIPIRDRLRGRPEDWTSRCEPNASQAFPDYVPYTLDYDRQGDETNEPPQLQKVYGGEEATAYVAPFFTLVERSEFPARATTTENYTSWRVPYIAEEGRNTAIDGLTKAPSLRLLFYRGRQLDSRGHYYPLAGHSRYAYGSVVVGNYSLDWQGEGGLYETWWKDFITMQSSGRVIKRRVRLTAADLAELVKWEKVVKTINDPQGQTKCVIKDVRVKITNTRIQVADVEFVTL